MQLLDKSGEIWDGRDLARAVSIGERQRARIGDVATVAFDIDDERVDRARIGKRQRAFAQFLRADAEDGEIKRLGREGLEF